MKGKTLREIAKRYKISFSSVYRHKEKHLNNQTKQEKDEAKQMRVLMKHTTSHSFNGITSNPFFTGNVYEVPYDLGLNWIKEGIAVKAEKDPEKEEVLIKKNFFYTVGNETSNYYAGRPYKIDKELIDWLKKKGIIE